MKGQGTFGMDNTGSKGKDKVLKLEIMEAATVLRNLVEDPDNFQLDLLHVNCEGCEYELLENIILNNLHLNIK